MISCAFILVRCSAEYLGKCVTERGRYGDMISDVRLINQTLRKMNGFNERVVCGSCGKTIVRARRRAGILETQFPTGRWHKVIGDFVVFEEIYIHIPVD